MTAKRKGKVHGKKGHVEGLGSEVHARGIGGAGGFSRWLLSGRNASLVVCLVSTLLYANTLGHDFVWDDYMLIVESPDVRKLDGHTVAKIFEEGLGGTDPRGGRYYRPLVVLSYHVDYKLFGGRPAGFHATNVVWNALACVLVFLFVRSLFRSVGLALVTSVVFATYPLHTENVAWVSGRTDIFAAVWCFVSLLCYVEGKRRWSVWMLLASLGSFALALLAKESAVCIPALILLLELGPFKSLLSEPVHGQDRQTAPRIHSGALTCIFFFGVLVAYVFARRAVLGPTHAYDSQLTGMLAHVALPLSILRGYVLKILFPFDLNAEYDASVPASFLDFHVMGGLVLVALLLVSLWRYRHRPDVVLAIGVFLLGLAPVLNIIPIAEISAERFLYFPSLGPALVLGSLATSALAARFPTSGLARGLRPHFAWSLPPSVARIGVPLFVLVLVGFAGRTVVRNMDWKSDDVLFAKTVRQQPKNARAQASLAAAAYRRGDFRTAVASYQKALELNPNYSNALSGLAGIYVQSGRYADALPLMERAVRVSPDNAQLACNLGSVYFEMGRNTEAAEQFEKALRMDSNEFRARFNLGLVRLEQKDFASARRHLQESLKGGPEFSGANYHLAMLEKAAGDTAQAEFYAKRFLDSHPADDALRREAAALLGTPK